MARCVMGELDAVLDGGKLVPQLALRAPGDPRAPQLRRRHALPRGRRGGESWDQMVRAVNFFGYAVWFN